MPTITKRQNYRFYRFSNNQDGANLFFVDQGICSAKFRIKPVETVWISGFDEGEIKTLKKEMYRYQTAIQRSAYVEPKPRTDEMVADVNVTDQFLTYILKDGRHISSPLFWFPRLLEANDRQRSHWQLCNAGFGVHWPYLDEDIGVKGMLDGIPAVHPNRFTDNS